MSRGDIWSQTLKSVANYISKEENSEIYSLVDQVTPISLQPNLNRKEALYQLTQPTNSSANLQHLHNYLEKLSDNLIRNQQRAKLYLYSDFAGTDWANFFNNFSPYPLIEFHPITLDEVDLKGNFQITDISWKRLANRNSNTEIIANVRNNSTLPQKINISVHTTNEEHHIKEILINADNTEEVRFELPNTAQEFHEGYVYIDYPDNYPLDNKTFFVIPQKASLEIIRVGHSLHMDDLFIPPALESSKQVAINWNNVKIESIHNELHKHKFDLLIIDQGFIDSKNLFDSITNALNRGIYILFLPNTDNELNKWEQKFLNNGHFQPTSNYSHLGKPNRFTKIDSNHPIFTPFVNHLRNDLFAIRFQQWKIFHQKDARVLAHLLNNEPGLSLLSSGKGQILIPSFQFNPDWSDWSVSRSFAPFIQSYVSWIEENMANKYIRELHENPEFNKITQPQEPGIYRTNHSEHPIAWNVSRRESELFANQFPLIQWCNKQKFYSDTAPDLPKFIVNKNKDYIITERREYRDTILSIFFVLLLIEFVLSFYYSYRNDLLNE
jgi:hypothetical protein